MLEIHYSSVVTGESGTFLCFYQSFYILSLTVAVYSVFAKPVELDFVLLDMLNYYVCSLQFNLPASSHLDLTGLQTLFVTVTFALPKLSFPPDDLKE